MIPNSVVKVSPKLKPKKTLQEHPLRGGRYLGHGPLPIHGNARGPSTIGFLRNEEGEGDLIMGLVMHEWHDILEKDRDMVRHNMWIDIFMDHISNRVVVFKNGTLFDLNVCRNLVEPPNSTHMFYI